MSQQAGPEGLPPAIFVMGPTASGKTDLAIRLAKAFNGEIISVDSALVYREMDIGTAKPTLEERAQCSHHLIDVCDPADIYSVSEFCADANRLMESITARARLPILTGGTMMYFRCLLNGMSRLPEADPKVRAEITAIGETQGWDKVHALLREVDPASAERINPNDPQRLQRALEVFRVSGKTMTEHRELEAKQAHVFPYDVCQIVPSYTDRAQLHQKIAERFDLMLSNGFEGEVSRLRNRGDLDLSLPSMRTVGYRQMWMHLDGAFSYDDMREKALAATRQLAKRQFTWLKSWQNVNWIYTDANGCSMDKHRQLDNSEKEASSLILNHFGERLSH